MWGGTEPGPVPEAHRPTRAHAQPRAHAAPPLGGALAGFAAFAACQHEQETGVRAVVTRGSGQRNNEARRSLRLGVREAQTMQRLENEKGRQAPLKKEYTALSLFFGRGGVGARWG